ncbi:unnamed protein product [Cyprideis torosa]|uniref:Fatty acid hydroxylase domain-containing protein n=1 Tax=Cyprideis torosa TaxID=163714 RepID=A0A7R8WD41_9CRUS|nr:unnamed protein product [Cyprideis torosa]CAG0894150.1 unnamed protein product [Cyprideis torosa]
MVSSAFEENCSAIDNHTTMQLPWETGEELSATQVLKSVEWLFYLVLKGIGWLFYIVDPRETTFQHPEDVPFYTLQSIPALGLLIVLENVVRWLQGKTWLRTNDGVTSLSLGILYLSYKFMLHGGQIALYVWAYENFRLFDLNWTSVWTWLWAAILVDFMYYWYHRGLHEINFFWAVHQAHHSGEDFNLCTAFRITGTQEFFNMLFHLPVVILGVPPAHWFVHRQFNLLFQFYIHTEVIKGLGPLEYILNTPSHHRVHHGSNRAYLDKNYAGVLIIWDRMFGTFEPEKEQSVYGLTHPINSFDPMELYFGLHRHIVRTAQESRGISNKLSVFFKGPGWSPGKPRLGLLEDFPDVSLSLRKAPQTKYDPPMRTWTKVYVWVHLAAMALLSLLLRASLVSSPLSMVLGGAFAMFYANSLGALINGDMVRARWMEIIKCLVCLVMAQTLSVPVLAARAFFFLFLASGTLWATVLEGKYEGLNLHSS